MRRNLFFSLFVTFTSTVAVWAEKPLGEAAETFKDKLPAGCITTGEWRDGRASFSVTGNAEPEGIAPERRVFEIGSITKVFTGLLLAQAVIEKKVKLDTTLQELLGAGFKFRDPEVGKITLVQLSTHTSGLPRLPGNIGPSPDSNPDPYAGYDRKKMDEFLATVKLKGAPPFEASYSNFAVGVLGELLARVYGVPWDALVKEKITEPLGMKDTMMTPGGDQRKRLAPPYQGKTPGTEWTFQAIAAAGALRSTAADLMIFGKAMMEPEKTPLAEAIRIMMQVHAPFGDVGGDIGLGVIIGKLDGEKDYMHTGGTGGYRSALQVIPTRKSVRVILINNDSLPAETLLGAVQEKKKASSAKTVVLSEKELDVFTGTYELSPAARFTVLRDEKTLRVRLTGQQFLPVKPIGGDRFRYDAVAAELQFNREAGAVKSLTLFQNGREIVARKTEEVLPAPPILKEAELEPYLGDYELAPGQILKITAKNDTLFVQLTGQPAIPAFPKKADYFELDVVKAALEFKKDAAGKVTSLILHQNGAHPAKKQ